MDSVQVPSKNGLIHQHRLSPAHVLWREASETRQACAHTNNAHCVRLDSGEERPESLPGALGLNPVPREVPLGRVCAELSRPEGLQGGAESESCPSPTIFDRIEGINSSARAANNIGNAKFPLRESPILSISQRFTDQRGLMQELP